MQPSTKLYLDLLKPFCLCPRCATWGAPRLGDAIFVEAFQGQLIRVARFINKMESWYHSGFAGFLGYSAAIANVVPTQGLLDACVYLLLGP